MAQREDLDEWFGEHSILETDRDNAAAAGRPLGVVTPTRLGVVVGGSLSKGLDIKLDSGASIEDLAVGRYVVVEGNKKRFFSMVTDIVLDHTNPQIMSAPPDLSDPFLAAVYTGTAAYGTVHVAPMLAIGEDGEPKPVKTVPSHFTTVYNATEEDVNLVFGQEDERHFYVGEPLELEETKIHLDLTRLVERSVGVFGKSGTGKSFLTRVILAGVIEKSGKSDDFEAVNLIFDMHNDYGWAVRDESGREVKGLRQLYGSGKVSIFTLDPESSRRREAPYDHIVTLGYDEIEPQDMEMLRQTMDLSDPMIDAAYVLHRKEGKGWIAWLLTASADQIEELRETTSINAASLAALTRRVERFERFGFLRPKAEDDSVKHIIHMLEQGKSVILEFGRYGNNLTAYILVANYLTRRIHDLYVHRMEESLAAGGQPPPQLLITIEEAHKFLDPAIARQTIFGAIAREMRKYNVTLLIVDQRPSAIDDEVLSQVGTRVTALLDNERDISAVLTGVSGAGGLREVLARLDTKQQAIILGHAVPMPVVVHTREWGPDFYRAASGYADEDAEIEAARMDAARLKPKGKTRL